MFDKLMKYRKCIKLLKEREGIVEGGFPFTSFHDFYKFYGDLGMLGYFLKFVQDRKFLIITSNKKLIIVEGTTTIFNKEVAIDPYNLVSRMWYGILIALTKIEKSL